MKILIIEDEKHNASRLQRILAELSDDYEVVNVLGTVKESVEWFAKGIKIDVALVDIRLADGLSFDIFDKIKVEAPIIFTTSYDEYAIRAFKVNSVDYLLKPIEREELYNALSRIVVTDETPKQSPDIEQLILSIKSQHTIYRKRFLLVKHNGYQSISVDEIDHIFLENKITYLITRDGKREVLQQTMDELEDELNPDDFFRANRQFIIHIDSIGMVQNSYNGKMKIVLKRHREKEIIVSREKAGLLKQWLDK